MLINVVDASNPERNLYLTLQLLELGILHRCVEYAGYCRKAKIRIGVDALAARLGCPVILLVSTRGRGIEALKWPSTATSKIRRLAGATRSRCCVKPAGSGNGARNSQRQRLLADLQMLEEAIFTSRESTPETLRKLDDARRIWSAEIADPALHHRMLAIRALPPSRDAVSNTLTR